MGLIDGNSALFSSASNKKTGIKPVENGTNWLLEPIQMENIISIELRMQTGAPGGTRTHDPLIKSQLLYQLSHRCISTPYRIRTYSLLIRSQTLYSVELKAYNGGRRWSRTTRGFPADLQSAPLPLTVYPPIKYAS